MIEQSSPPVASATSTPPRAQAARDGWGGPDRLTVGLLSLTAFLLVLALLGTQIGGADGGHTQHRALLLRRIYVTTVVERVLPAGSGPRDGSSVTQSSSTLGAAVAPVAPITRVS